MAGPDTSITAAERRKEEQRQERAAQLARQEEAQIRPRNGRVLGEKQGEERRGERFSSRRTRGCRGRRRRPDV